MSTLSSCYFCGIALDAPVEAHPIVPEGIPSDDDRTVSLCPTCRRKYHGLLDVAFDAVDGIDSIETTLDESVDLAEGAADVDDGSTTVSPDSTDPTTDEPSGPSGKEDAADDDTADQDSDGERGSAPEDGSAATAPDDEGAEVDARDESSAESDTDGESEDGTANADDDTREADSEQAVDSERPEPAAASGAGDEGDDASDGAGDTPSILSTPVAKKVVRLLQNREFPVEREEFAVVAANAYDIPEDDCADVIDTLVSEGYVGEQGGQLVRE
ncbi:hypothetical protein [Halorientalis salina]|uniref:hypothetical protein n=1 Tax=Halorientalis salina TaxID=2932266 RepID=UPI0010AC85F7|nr:hypothetical protein [Halorientalis salina]